MDILRTANPRGTLQKCFETAVDPSNFAFARDQEYSHRPPGINSKSNLKAHQIPT
jgi:hypothetical protein